jgi:hypothetical protein
VASAEPEACDDEDGQNEAFKTESTHGHSIIQGSTIVVALHALAADPGADPVDRAQERRTVSTCAFHLVRGIRYCTALRYLSAMSRGGPPPEAGCVRLHSHNV